MLLGPLVLVVPYRHPIQLAKTVATLDVISSGRLVLGVGLGWNETEFTVNALVFLNPKSRVQVYLLAGFGWSSATGTSHGASGRPVRAPLASGRSLRDRGGGQLPRSLLRDDRRSFVFCFTQDCSPLLR